MPAAPNVGSYESLAQDIAAWHARASSPQCPRGSGRRLRRPLARRFQEIYSALADFSAPPGSTEAAGLEWLLDNHHVVLGALIQLNQDLPTGHFRRLPAVRGPGGRALPRLAHITACLLEATGLPLDLVSLQSALDRVQRRMPLCLSELWALPTFLRTTLLQRLAEAADGMLAHPARAPGDAGEQDSAEAAGTVISSCILSLRQLATFKWADFVERASLVHEALRGDPAGVYAAMDFESRNRYRSAVEEIAESCGLDELRVARAAIDLAQARSHNTGSLRDHVGYYLVDSGRQQFESTVGARPALRVRAHRFMRRHATSLYLGLIMVPALVLVLAAVYAMQVQGLPLALTLAIGFVALVPAISLATLAANLFVTQVVPPETLLRLDFEYGIADEWPTVVVMPAMLAGDEWVARLARNLEINYLGNSDPSLRFALLTDCLDGESEHDSTDAERVALAVAAIDSLNARYGNGTHRPFALFHRRRLWNRAEGRWMGWERKRGKLVEFNRLLLGDDDTSFGLCHADLEEFRRARLVITLDADTCMPAGVAASLAGILAHPLNRAVTDPTTGQVVRGFTAVQPRVEIDPSSVDQTPFSRLFAGDVALDPYVHAVSDVYQDLFGAGIFAGKGAYDLRAFHASLEGRIPDNLVLSHDLLEGLHGRVGYASDVMLLEDFPHNLAAMMRRMHRWVRGDWQLLRWLTAGLTRPGDGVRLAQFGTIDRWKMLDNLRRSLHPVALAALLLMAWFAAPEPLAWTLAVVAVTAAPVAVKFITASRGVALRFGTLASTLRAVGLRIGGEVIRWLAGLAFLAFEASTAANAIARALWRQWISHRLLLEWEPASETAARYRGENGLGSRYRIMWLSWTTGLAALALVGLQRPAALVAAAPIAGLWCLAPWFAARLGRPTPQRADVRMAAPDAQQLRALARRTWRYFEQFVGPEGHWLPPDNVQTAPGFKVAQRTSPTNIGLGLLATLSAYDFGYVSRHELVARLRSTLQTLAGLEGYRGHLYNWYDTQTLRPLEPRYVSTVDSGNLVAALVTLLQALPGIRDVPGSRARIRSGLADTLSVLAQSLRQAAADAGDPAAVRLADRVRIARRVMLDAAPDATDELQPLSDLVAMELEPGLIGMIERDESKAGLQQIEELAGWVRCLAMQIESAGHGDSEPHDLDQQIGQLCGELDRIVAGTDFRFLFDARRRLFHVGYNASAGEVDGSHYDLLASEARIASFVAIAKGDVPPGHWIQLGRPLRRIHGSRALLSWSATAFEYFMPRLLMKTPESGLLFRSCLVAVAEQQRMAHRLGVPWGISESGYYQMDVQGEYQYRAFGLPRLALRREQADRVVITPYASLLALPFDPGAVLSNLRALIGLGLEGPYGLAEAADFGHVSGRDPGRPRIVQAFMTHHQGMILAALGNAVHGDLMMARFHADPRIASVEYLLYERMPDRPQAQPLQEPLTARPRRVEAAPSASEWSVDPARPAVNVLSNGHLRTLTSSQGGGASYWNDIMINRWRPDADGEYGGAVLFFRDLDSGEVWSLGWDELGGDVLEVEFGAAHSEYRLRRHGLMARLAVAIVPDGDLEVRRLTLSNDLARPRHLQIGFQADPVMAREAEDRRHPAFNKLFVECVGTVAPAELLFRRRPRAADETSLYLGYGVAGGDQVQASLQSHRDRASFVGRRGNSRRPAAFSTGGGEPAVRDGPVLDPTAALTVTVRIPPTASVQCAFLMAVGNDSSQLLELLDRYRSLDRVAWAFAQARIAASSEVQQLGLLSDELSLAMGMARQLLWPQSHAKRAAALRDSSAAQGSLWSRGLSGDYPVAILRLRGPEDLSAAESLLRLHALLYLRGFRFDVAFLDEASSGYSQPTRDQLVSLIDRSREVPGHRQRGHAIIIPARDLSPTDRANLIAAAGSLIDPEAFETTQTLTLSMAQRALPEFIPVPSAPLEDVPIAAVPRPGDLLFDNGYGGFTTDSREYQVYIEAGRHPPMPWVNVMANPDFGALVSDGGLGCTWANNSSENRLTPWYNDAVTDRPGEVCYLRDEESAIVWSPTPLPLPGPGPYCVSHGAGYSRYEHNSQGLEQVLTVFVDATLPVKFVRLSLTNRWPRTRRLTATLALEWVLGNDRSQTGPWLVTGRDSEGRVLIVRNAFDRVQPQQTAFLTATRPPHGVTANRADFIGRTRDGRQVPAALRLVWPGGGDSSGGDPCAAYQAHLMVGQGETTEITFVIGHGATQDQALELARSHLTDAAIEQRWLALGRHWDGLLGSLQVETPDAAMNLLANRWLLYQSLSCRMWGRSGFYQPGGAYGFRDQLQDSLALLHTRPDLTREHVLQAAAAQFPEGDVLHWWHESPVRGVRTRISDDPLWLPYATAAYVNCTGDEGFLEARVPYRAGEPLQPSETERYAEYAQGALDDTLYEHCCRAVDARLNTGVHGLPLIGTGDWNDGLNRVGRRGKGESVWMAWFAIHVCRDFAPLCRRRGDTNRAERYERFAETLAQAAHDHAWDGGWFLRGYFDDGATLGSYANEACRIDLNAQTWAVLADAAPRERQLAAMQAVRRHLADPAARVLRLLAPPFDRGGRDPGYIQGYPPGVRDNEGEYNHAAVWAVWAAARLG